MRVRGRARTCAWLVLLGWVACAPDTGAPDSVVLFLIDTLRADRVGAYGYPRPTTPNLDALAAEGVVFEQAYAPAPWTLPSVVSLLTATPPCEHGVVVDGLRVSPALPTLAESLRDAGLVTASFFANEYAGPSSGLTRGFETTHYAEHAEPARIDAWLETIGERPFLLYVHNVEPHDPYTAPQSMVAEFGTVAPRARERVNELSRQYRRLTRADWSAGRSPGASDNSAAQQQALDSLARLGPALSTLYDADVRLADERLGGVVEVLRRRGRLDRTLFVVLSDHGEELGEHGGFQHDQSLYEELVRVPLVMRFPGAAHAGTRVREPVSLLDVAPTVAEALGLPPLPGRGRSLLPALAEADAAPSPGTATPLAFRDNRKKFFAPWARSRGDQNLALREGRWKAVWNAGPATLELYDLRHDPAERRDRSADDPARAERLGRQARGWIDACRRRGEGRRPSPAPDLDAEARARLRALGYAD